MLKSYYEINLFILIPLLVIGYFLYNKTESQVVGYIMLIIAVLTIVVSILADGPLPQEAQLCAARYCL